jgi:hypothetical protein
MATPIEDGEVQGTETGGGESSPGLNPAWSEALSAIPEQFHGVLTPHFQQWDQSAQSKIEQANSQLRSFEAYKEFVDNDIKAEDLAQGYQLLYQLTQDPQAVYNALGEAYGFGAAVPNPEGEETEETDETESQNFLDPRVDQLQSNLDLVAQTLIQQEEAKIAAAADEKLDAEINALKEKYPNFDERYVLSLVANGATMEEAAQSYETLTQQILQQNPRPFAPQVMGTSGGGTGLPSQAIDPTKLGDKDRRALVAQMVARQMAE